MSTTPGAASERPVSDPSARDRAAGAEPTAAESATTEPAATVPATTVPATTVPAATSTSHEVAVRRAPKYQTFILIGVIVGLIAAMILTFAFQRTPNEIDAARGEVYFSPGAVFGFLLLVCIPIGIAVFGLLAWILDVRARKKTHTVRVDKVNVRVSEPEAEAPPAATTSADHEDNL
ncbi:hypothetical protein [Paramicrobacterium fandaimingii]|uniref:hypothetical protein n=1 Tax=Paramicrobacterium fandaimingii TaxID=2708079 RepID=UPI001F3C0F44|nr:hypothetical protein [Microbacterium fandaimingii]